MKKIFLFILLLSVTLSAQTIRINQVRGLQDSLSRFDSLRIVDSLRVVDSLATKVNIADSTERFATPTQLSDSVSTERSRAMAAEGGKQPAGTYLVPTDSTKIRGYSNSLYQPMGTYLVPTDSTTLKNSLLKNADSTAIRNYSNSLYLQKSDTTSKVVTPTQLSDSTSTERSRAMAAEGTKLSWSDTTATLATQYFVSHGFQPTISGLTSGYVPYWNGTVLANSNAYFDGTNWGFGTTRPENTVDIRNYSQSQLKLTSLKGGIHNEAGIDFLTYNAGSTITRNVNISAIDYGSFNAGIVFSTKNNSTPDTILGERMRIDKNGYVGILTTSPVTTLTDGGGIAYNFSAQTGDYFLVSTDHILTINASSAACGAYLLSVVGIKGQNLIIKKSDSSVNSVTLYPSGTETIDGAASYVLSAQWKYVSIIADGTSNWLIIGNN